MSGTRSWERRCSQLNHVWLKGYLTALSRWLNSARGELADPEFDSAAVLEDWRSHRNELMELAASYRTEAGPAALFSNGRLMHCPASTRAWLQPLNEIFWQSEDGRALRASAFSLAVAAADRRVDLLMRRARRTGRAARAANAREVGAFREACCEVSRALTAMATSAR